MSEDIRAIVALGNPGAEHARDRHNAGFWLADSLAQRRRLSFSGQKRFKGEMARIGTGAATVWLLKPMTFMNLVGEAVAALCAFHKISARQLLVVHDDLDLPPGTARLKESGGHGGHNGLRDIHRVIGSQYKRLRIGIGHPGDSTRVLAHVLGRPSANDADAIAAAIEAGMDAIDTVIAGGWNRGAQQLNSRKSGVGS